jgi:hypothetical protein
MGTDVDTSRLLELERTVERLQQVLLEQQRVITRMLGGDVPDAGPSAVREDTAPSSPSPTQGEPAPSTPIGRRDVLRRGLAAGGALAAMGAGLAAQATPAAAATGDQVLAGTQTNVESTTVLYADLPAGSSAFYPDGLLAVTDTPFKAQQAFRVGPAAVNGYGDAQVQVGVRGYGNGIGVGGGSATGWGVFGTGQVGVKGVSDRDGGYGVMAVTTSIFENSAGLAARGSGLSPAVLASNTGPFGIAIRAEGYSLFDGGVAFRSSGLARVVGTKRRALRSVAVKVPNLGPRTLALATVQGDGGNVGVSGVIVDWKKGGLTITLTSAVKRTITIAWFVFN